MPAVENQIRVAALCGSMSDRLQHPDAPWRWPSRALARPAPRSSCIDLNDHDLVFCRGDDNQEMPDGVLALRAAIKASHGLILGTPEYHGSFSGVLKNAIDLMGFEEFEGKMIGLVGVAGGAMGALSALASLRTIGRSLHAWVVPQQVTVAQAWKVFDAEGRITDAALEKRLLEVGRQVARFAFLHSSEQAKEFLRLWEGAPLNPGA